MKQKKCGERLQAPPWNKCGRPAKFIHQVKTGGDLHSPAKQKPAYLCGIHAKGHQYRGCNLKLIEPEQP